MKDRKTCNACGKSDFIKKAGLISATDGEKYSVLKCRSCGLTFSDPIPDLTFGKLQKIYNIDYTKHQRQQPDPETERILTEATEKQLDIIEKYVAKGKALNIGAMDHGSRTMKKRGWDVTVVEVSKYASETAREIWGLDVINSRAEEADLEDESFDLIKLGHVIEHFEDPAFVVKKMAKALKPGGILLIETVNSGGLRTSLETGIRSLLGENLTEKAVNKLTGKSIKSRYGWLFPPIHIYTFTAKSILSLINKAGLSTLALKQPAAGDKTWFPVTPQQTNNMNFPAKAFFTFSRLGSLINKGDIIIALAKKM